MTPDTPRLLTAVELAARLGVSRDTVMRLTHRREIPCHRIGRSVRFDWPAVVAATQQVTEASEHADRRMGKLLVPAQWPITIPSARPRPRRRRAEEAHS